MNTIKVYTNGAGQNGFFVENEHTTLLAGPFDTRAEAVVALNALPRQPYLSADPDGDAERRMVAAERDTRPERKAQVQTLAAAVMAHARTNYEDPHRRWDAVVECHSIDEIQSYLLEHPEIRSAEAAVEGYWKDCCAAYDAQRKEIEAEIF